MGNDECTETQIKFQDSQNPSVFVMTPTVGRKGPYLTAANHAVITQKFCILNEQWQAFAQVLRLRENRVPHSWLLNTGPGGYDTHASDLHQHCAVAQMKVLNGLTSRPNITRMMIHRILESGEDHMKWVTENRYMLQSDDPSSLIVRMLHQGMTL